MEDHALGQRIERVTLPQVSHGHSQLRSHVTHEALGRRVVEAMSDVGSGDAWLLEQSCGEKESNVYQVLSR